MPKGQYKRKSRKPSIATAAPQTTETETPDLMETAVHHLNGIHAALNEFVKLTAERNDLLKEFQAKQGERDERVVAALEQGSLTVTGDTKLEVTPPKKEAKPKPEKKPEPPACKHENAEKLQRPGLARCKDCGAIIDVPVEEPPKNGTPAKAQTVEVPKKEPEKKPAEAAPAIMDENEFRASAINFASKHGKPALSEVLKKAGCTNVSGVPPEMRAKIAAELNSAG